MYTVKNFRYKDIACRVKSFAPRGFTMEGVRFGGSSIGLQLEAVIHTMRTPTGHGNVSWLFLRTPLPYRYARKTGAFHQNLYLGADPKCL